MDAIDNGRGISSCPGGSCHSGASGLIREANLVLMDAIFDVAVVIVNPGIAIISPVAYEVVVGIIFVGHMVV